MGSLLPFHARVGTALRRLPACLMLLLAMPAPLSADVLTAVNGERFVGKTVSESAEAIVFESEVGGRLTIPRSRVLKLERAPSAGLTETNRPAGVQAGSAGDGAAAWHPPGAGTDGFDWLQLTSSEWLKGELRYLHGRNVRFESDKLEELDFKLKDVRQFYSGKPMFAKFEGREQVYGTVLVSNNLVEVVGPEQVSLARADLTGITPGGEHEIDFWSLKASVGVSLQSGNTKQTTLNSSARLARRTPATQFLLEYLGNFSEVNGAESANDHRANATYDVRLNRDWFIRPVQFEWYRDQPANLAARLTAAVGVGYYIFDSDTLEWTVAAGPGYQYTRFQAVEAGQSDTTSTPAAVLQTSFAADLTQRLTFTQTFASTLSSEASGLYSHHAVSTLEFEIKHHLDLDVSFVWDYLQNPKTDSSGQLPQQSDLRLVFGLGVKF